METSFYVFIFPDNKTFRSYPTYEEWKLKKNIKGGMEMTVLILPMRNGNTATASIVSDIFDSSYPTYEEWKLSFSSSTSSNTSNSFLSYL